MENKKVIIINASPRKNFNTAKLLKSAQEGAASVGFETEFINLVELNYKGCVSCYACKRKDGKTNGLCAYRDELTPVLEKILNAQAVIIGTPIYYGNHSGLYRNLFERLHFAACTYVKDSSTGFTKRAINKYIPFGIINTMGATEVQYKNTYMPSLFGHNQIMLKLVFGYCESMNVFDTSHVRDYSKYDCDLFDQEHKKEILETQFPMDLDRAFNFGKRIALS